MVARTFRILIVLILMMGVAGPATAGQEAPAPTGGAEAGLISAGENHSCAVTTGGGVKCCGANWYGQLGDGTITNRPEPVEVVGLSSGVRSVAAGGYHTCAVTPGSEVKCWGYDDNGQLGDGRMGYIYYSSQPVDVIGLSSGAAAVFTGGWHSCALMTGGAVKCWGYNGNGELGDGTETSRSSPVDVIGLPDVVADMSPGGNHTCMVSTGGEPKCWGANFRGQLGDGTWTGYSTAPVAIAGLSSGVAVMAGGDSHTCAATTGGAVKCWGENTYGQLGLNPGWTPVTVVGLEGAIYRSMMRFPLVEVQ